MRSSRPAFASRLVAVLVVLQLLAGLTACQAWDKHTDSRASAPASLDAPTHESDDNAAGHHHHADSGNHECLETFIPPGCQRMPMRLAQTGAWTLSDEDASSPAYDVPPPIPITV